jgi:hypothetical protein
MGLLDDAIREHLDLKRRRGADPAEVERAEREALGPVRRGQQQPEQVETEIDEELAYDEEDEQDWGEPFDDEPFDAEADESVSPQAPEPKPLASEQPRRRGLLRRVERPEPDEAPESDQPPAETRGATTPAPHPAPPPKRPKEHGGDETVEYQVEEAEPEQEGGKDADDVLEETPEFLQDTPDHDRLWFEQRPPRDFDFDG